MAMCVVTVVVVVVVLLATVGQSRLGRWVFKEGVDAPARDHVRPTEIIDYLKRQRSKPRRMEIAYGIHCEFWCIYSIQPPMLLRNSDALGIWFPVQ